MNPIRHDVTRRNGPYAWVWTLALMAGAVFSVACASSRGAVPRPFPMPGARAGTGIAEGKPGTGIAEGETGTGVGRAAFDGYALAGTALTLRGTPYRNGGSDPTGFDCSGFTQYVFAQYGIGLPREVRGQYTIGRSVEPSDLAPGDLVFFTTTDPGASHVAIAIGGDEFVHAPSSSGVVRVEHLSGGYWSPRFLGARRVTN